MCGEHRSIVGIGVACQGSSPHVRGAPKLLETFAQTFGIIPACAGSTISGKAWTVDCRDHPRMCGEHLSFMAFSSLLADHPRMCGEHNVQHGTIQCYEGSSPHVRGARRQAIEFPLRTGIIPACAGSTWVRRFQQRQQGDHPRMCGEHSGITVGLAIMAGSSPHVRGAHRQRSERDQRQGIIPACAGSTRGRPSPNYPYWDHPRMCGEHSPTLAHAFGNLGSSPHVRGAHYHVRQGGGRPGIIPACAGSTSRAFMRFCTVRDHPRMCGEHESCSTGRYTTPGSSPHVRGALPLVGMMPTVHGIIPACAGSTHMRRSVAMRARDHPRMCGEHTSKIA